MESFHSYLYFHSPSVRDNTVATREIWSHFTRTLYFHSPSVMTLLSLLVKYLVIFHADPCNKSYILYFPTICNHSYGGDTQERSFVNKGEGDEFSGRGKRQRRPCHLWGMLRVMMTSAIAKKENSVMQV